jgi:Mg-chelatase subunit ChlD
MIPEQPITPREELESKLTALLLGELPPEQAFALGRAIEQDPELKTVYERLKQTVQIVREASSAITEPTASLPAKLKLSEGRRQQLLQHFKTVRPAAFVQKPPQKFSLLRVAAMVAVICMLTVVFVPSLSKAKHGSRQSFGFFSSGGNGTLQTASVTAPSEDDARKLAKSRERFRVASEQETLARKAQKAESFVSLAPQQTDPAPLALPIGDQASARRYVLSSTASSGAPGPDYANSVDFNKKLPEQALAGGLAGTPKDRVDSYKVVQPPPLGTIVLPSTGLPELPTETAHELPQLVSDAQVDNMFLYKAQSEPKRDMFSAGGPVTGGKDFDKKEVSDLGKAVTPANGLAFGTWALADNGPQQSPPVTFYDELAEQKPGERAAAAPIGGTFNPDGRKPGELANVELAKSVATRAGLGTSNSILAWTDNQHQKQGNLSLADSRGEPPSSSLLQDHSLSITNNPQYDSYAYYRTLAQDVEPQSKSRIVLPGNKSASDESVALSKPKQAVPQDSLNGPRFTTNGGQEPRAVEVAQLREAEDKLNELTRRSELMRMELASERIDTSLPKTTMVEISTPAEADSGKSPSLLEKIRGKTERHSLVRIEREASDVSPSTKLPQTAEYDPHFVQNEFEVIQSEKVLGKVVKELKLDEAWASKSRSGEKLEVGEAVQLLKRNLDLRFVKGTSLVDIGVTSAKPEEAAKIANAVADSYRTHRLEQEREFAQNTIKKLEERVAETDQKVREAREEVNRRQTALKNEKPAETLDLPVAKSAVTALIPPPEVQTLENSFSTFSLNVSDVSFKLAAASLEKGIMPEPATIRSEEFINAFDYRDPEPTPGVPVGFTWERGQYPFAQNRDVLRFSIKTAAQGRQPGKPLNLVLLLDNSGSMERADRVQIIHEALKVLASQLQAQDILSVVTFARTARLMADAVPGTQAGKVAEEAGKLTPEGGTNLEEAMNLAYQTAHRHFQTNGVNRVVLLTDGAANLGNVEPTSLKSQVETQRQQGIALDCFGIGWDGYNDDLLEVLSRNGDGRYGFINTPEEAATGFAGQLAGALQVAASDVKVQVEFNAKRATAFRQIGYAKHQLTKEQFRDNTVDAAEIGAAESGNALYILEVNPSGEGPLAIVRVRYKLPGTAEYREHEWTVPYNGHAAALEQSTPAMRLAATASAFSEWLVSSPYSSEISPDRLLGYLRGVPETYGNDPRPSRLEWMIRQAKSLTGK